MSFLKEHFGLSVEQIVPAIDKELYDHLRVGRIISDKYLGSGESLGASQFVYPA